MTVAGLSLLALFIGKLGDWYGTTHHLHLPPPSVTITHSDTKPNEAKVDTGKDIYNVPADQPRLLELPAIGVKGFIQQVGIDQFGAIATPTNIHMAGWYTGSVKPGEDGVSIIDGHVHGRYEPAIFYTLKDLKVGDAVAVEYGNGRRVTFSVTKVSQYDKGSAAAHLFEKQPSITRQLVLVTCGGTFDKSSQTYTQRVVVYAKRI